MAESSDVHPARAVVRGVLFVIGTLAWLFVVYVLAVNLAAAVRGEAGDWTQALFAVVPAAAIGIGVLMVRSWLR